jgi:hypothetical protein
VWNILQGGKEYIEGAKEGGPDRKTEKTVKEAAYGYSG